MPVNSRKIYVATHTLLVTLAIFVLFTILTGRTKINQAKRPKPAIQHQPQIENIGQIGEIGIGTVETAKFINFNENKQIIREFGFETLLHKSSEQWEIAKPFLNVYQEDFNCHIVADNGVVLTDESISEDISLSDAQLTGNVIIKITPKARPDLGPVDIYLDDLKFVRDRSLFYTAGPVKIISANTKLLGQGMELVYNYQRDKLELFKINHLVSLELNDINSKYLSRSENPPLQYSSFTTLSDNKQKPALTERYQVILNKNVTVKAAGELIVADESLSIHNIIRKKPAVPKKSTLKSHSADTTQTDTAFEPVDILITCDNEFVIAPEGTNLSNSGLLQTYRLKEKTIASVDSKDANSLTARKINYNALTDEFVAIGPARLKYHAKSNDPDIQQSDTIIVDAQEQISYHPKLQEVIFKGDCVFTMLKQHQAGNRKYIMKAPNFAAKLSYSQNNPEKASLKYFRAEPDVILHAETMPQKDKIASLIASQLDYDSENKNVIAWGPARLTLFAEQEDTAQSIPVKIVANGKIDFSLKDNHISFDGGCYTDIPNTNKNDDHHYQMQSESMVVTLIGKDKEQEFSSSIQEFYAMGAATIKVLSNTDSKILAEFTANQIRYDKSKEKIIAPGPSRLQLHAHASSNKKHDVQGPLAITAQKETVFLPSKNEIYFNGNCSCSMVRIDSGEPRKYILNAPQIVVRLREDTDNNASNSSVEHITAGHDATIIVTPVGSPTELARFKASWINYSAVTNQVVANGPVNFSFYANDFMQDNDLSSVVPVIISAQKNARFLPSRNLITFEDNCICSMTRKDGLTQNKYTLSAQKLLINTSAKKHQDPENSSMGIRKITATGPLVQITNIKTTNDQLLSLTKLKCKKFTFLADDKFASAVGPGIISIDNSRLPSTRKANSLSFNVPCYAFVRDFDILSYNLKTDRIKASAKDNKMLMDYLTAEKEPDQKHVKASASRVNIQIKQDSNRAELSSLEALGGITYEDMINQFTADQLRYDVETGIVRANGSEFQRCYLNKAIVDNIVYDLNKSKVINTDIYDPAKISSDR